MKALGVTSEEQVRDFFPPRRRRVTETADDALPHTPFPSTQVTKLLDRAYKSLERKLRHKKYFFGRPTTLDAVAYAHLLLHRSSPVGALLYKDVLGKYPALSKYVDGISEAHFGPGAGLRDCVGLRRRRGVGGWGHFSASSGRPRAFRGVCSSRRIVS